MGPKSQWSGPVRLLSQTRPIPRSPDGDKNLYDRYCIIVLHVKQSSSSKRFVVGSLKDPIHLYVTPMCTAHSAVINCSKLVDDLNTIKGIVWTREAFVGCHLRMLNFLLTQLRAHSSAIFEGGLCLFALAPQQPSTHILCNTTIGATFFQSTLLDSIQLSSWFVQGS